VNNVLINSTIRSKTGSNASNRLRNTGYIPAVLYGRFLTNQPIQLESKELNNVIKEHGENAVLKVIVEDATYTVMIKEIQRDITTSQIIHVDLQQINESEKIHASVPILLAGKEKIKNSGILQHQLKKLEIECYPTNVPKYVSVDISKLATEGALRISDVEFGEDFTVLNSAEEIIAALTTENTVVDVDEEEQEDEITLWDKE